ncbi:MAG: nucleoid occlusion factor SlmA [Pseudomonadota bacterium]
MAKPGERKLQILQTLAMMLESPTAEKITTAALAAKLSCSEAALYRHFASKAQMFEGLIEFIESSLFGVINQIAGEESPGLTQVEHILALLLNFAQRNRGMTKVLIGDALVNENTRLQARINQLLDRVEAALKQALRIAATQGDLDAETDFSALANLLLCYAIGRWQQYVKSSFARTPAAHWPQQWPMLLNACIGAKTAQDNSTPT